MVTNAIRSAQTQVEAQHFEMRKDVLKYDDVMNTQRMVIYEQRRSVLNGDDHSDLIRQWIEDVVRRNVDLMAESAEGTEEWDLEGLVAQMASSTCSCP
jgi:preprotein translocase subunit SecA